MQEPIELSPVEARILGVLVEKQATVPDTYPLSLNSLVTGCNQKTGRDPIMEVTEAQALAAIDELRCRDLIIESSGSRVARYSHNVGRVFQIPAPAVALLAMLALRSAQTAAELRSHCDRLYRFADISSVEAYLEELATRSASPLVVLLPRQPGARESRWMHLLCGQPEIAAVSATAPAAREDRAGLAAEVAALREEVASLREEVAALKAMFE